MTAIKPLASFKRNGPIPHLRVESQNDVESLYEFGSKLGQGSFGLVFEAKHTETQEVWAIKIVNKEKAGSVKLKLLDREISILKKVFHPHIIELKEVFETPEKVYLVTELCQGGELAEIIRARGPYSESDGRTIMKGTASAISYLHMKEIVHRDLKLENILVKIFPNEPTDYTFVKVTDFGLAVLKGTGHENLLQSVCGTLCYMAPEIFEYKSYSQQCDAWSLGIIMYCLFTGFPPYRGKDQDQISGAIKSATLDFSHEQFKNVSQIAIKCIKELLQIDPAHRLSASELLQHPWITGDCERVTTNVLDMMKSFRLEQEQQTSSTSAKSDTCKSPSRQQQPRSTRQFSSASATISSNNSNSSKGRVSTVRKFKSSTSRQTRQSPISTPASKSKGRVKTSSSSSCLSSKKSASTGTFDCSISASPNSDESSHAKLSSRNTHSSIPSELRNAEKASTSTNVTTKKLGSSPMLLSAPSANDSFLQPLGLR